MLDKHPLIKLLLAPFVGLAFIVFMPIVTYGIVIYYLGAKIKKKLSTCSSVWPEFSPWTRDVGGSNPST